MNDGSEINAAGYKQMLASAFEYQDRLHELIRRGQDINCLLDIDEIMATLINSAIKLTESGIGAAALFNRNKVIFNQYKTIEKILPIECRFKRGEGILGMVMDTKRPYVCNNTELSHYMPYEIQKELKIHNFVCMPILSRQNEFLGFFEIYNKKNMAPYNEIDIDILNDLSKFGASAVENSRLMGELNKFGEELEVLMGEVSEHK
jgi:GAF domain-containing protein